MQQAAQTDLIYIAPTKLGQQLFSPALLAFLTALHQRFEPTRQQLLNLRAERAQNPKHAFDFLPQTAHIREADWQAAPIPEPLKCRKVEITGPVERKMIINALNSGAHVFMADFEDSCAPTFQNIIQGHLNLCDAVRKNIAFENPDTKKRYVLNNQIAILMVRPRGWHLTENHVTIADEPISASLFDFGIFAFLNAHKQISQGEVPCFYLPKMESFLEARLWNEVFVFTQNFLSIPVSTFKATVLIETLPAAFQMEEIIYELRLHILGLNCGRWDYIFSYIKETCCSQDRILPERAQITMTVPFMRAYAKLLIQTCHRRGVFAMGGMAAQIPIKNNETANRAAMDKVKADKLREVNDGFDGTWVAHPGLVAMVKSIFDDYIQGNNQMHKQLDEKVHAAQLLELPSGNITPEGFLNNIDVALQYLANWLAGNGCVPIHNLMEDAATAEISRVQLWQWIKFGAKLSNNTTITATLFEQALANCLNHHLLVTANLSLPFNKAAAILQKLVLAPELQSFLTTSAYKELINN